MEIETISERANKTNFTDSELPAFQYLSFRFRGSGWPYNKR